MKRIRKKKALIALFLAAVFVAACNPRLPAGGEGFAIYRAASPGAGVADPGASLASYNLQEPPVITGQDILSYDLARHEMQLTPEAFSRFEKLFEDPQLIIGQPFVVTVNKTPVYAGVFWSLYISRTYEGIVINIPMDSDRYRILISLGYPSPEYYAGSDPRSDARIVNALKSARKLKE